MKYVVEVRRLRKRENEKMVTERIKKEIN